VEKPSANHAQNERHHNESQAESLFKDQKENLFDLKKAQPASSQPLTRLSAAISRSRQIDISLDFVLRSCPAIQDYAAAPIRSWRELADAGQLVARFLGIAQSAYAEALLLLGQERTAVIIAWILQRIAKIKSAGGYLRFLLGKARIGHFSV
ncbi:replication initiation protein RepC, partial [Bacillus sp. IG2]|uniref:replication initiation protein RepC n=1 Tax=Bacillus sp. IG2 TaxID=3075931 RepID=UPI0028F8542A